MDQDELTLFRDMARRALAQEIAPHIEEWEARHAVPRTLWNTLGAAGLLCPDLPEAYGAAGASARGNVFPTNILSFPWPMSWNDFSTPSLCLSGIDETVYNTKPLTLSEF